ncbi:hypothetical protein N665_0117s0011 [Sinapis alba]|nr:hypothetical protein N665_0117s0011 [Sinapis alba]
MNRIISLHADFAVKSPTNIKPISPALGKSYCLPQFLCFTKLILNSTAPQEMIRPRACLKALARTEKTMEGYHRVGVENQLCDGFDHVA